MILNYQKNAAQCKRTLLNMLQNKNKNNRLNWTNVC